MTCRKGLLRCGKKGHFRSQGGTPRPDCIGPPHTAKPWKTCIARRLRRIAAMRKQRVGNVVRFSYRSPRSSSMRRVRSGHRPHFSSSRGLERSPRQCREARRRRETAGYQPRAIIGCEISRMRILGCHHGIFPLDCNGRCRPTRPPDEVETPAAQRNRCICRRKDAHETRSRPSRQW